MDPLENVPDGALIAGYVGGDEAAFTELVRRHAPMVAAASRRLVDADAADDVAQAAFLVLARKARGLRRHPCIGGWLYRTTVALARQSRASAAARARRERATALAARRPDAEAAASLASSFDEAMAELPERQRRVVVLHHLEGRSHAAIARDLGLASGTVAWLLNRAREGLRAGLARRGVTVGAVALVAALASMATAAEPLAFAPTPATASSSAAALARAFARAASLQSASAFIGVGALLVVVAAAVAVGMRPKSPFDGGLLANGGFEAAGSGGAAAWNVFTWGDARASSARETTLVHGGHAALRFTVASLGAGDPLRQIRPPAGAIALQHRDDAPLYEAGRLYRASVWLYAPSEMLVEVMLQRQPGPTPFIHGAGARVVQVGPRWQRVDVEGGFEAPTWGDVGVMALTPGTVVLDDARLEAIALPELPAVAREPAPPAFFGMHLNWWGDFSTTHPEWPSRYTRWPADLRFGLLRLMDCGLRWYEVEPRPGVFAWDRFDAYVAQARAHHEELLYAFGFAPPWAGGGEDHAGVPDRAAWRRYVAAVAARYRGVIRRWELWNEFEVEAFFRGSLDDILDLSRIAYEELKRADPDSVVSAVFSTPNVLAIWLHRGGGACMDAIAFHDYRGMPGDSDGRVPELGAPVLHGFRWTAAAAGAGALRLRNSEASSVRAFANAGDEAGFVARTFILARLFGLEGVDWYSYELNSPRLQTGDFATRTAAGDAYAAVVGWLTGARIVDRATRPDGTWIVALTLADGRAARLAWNERGSASLALPPAWRARRGVDLAGHAIDVARAPAIAIGHEPLLIECDASSP